MKRLAFITILLCTIAAYAEEKSHNFFVFIGDSAVDRLLISVDREWVDEQGTHYSITNHYPYAITALLLFSAHFDSAGKQTGEGMRTYDAQFNRAADPDIPPNGQRIVTIGTANTKLLRVFKAELAAAVFADGTTSGDPRAIQFLIAQRKMLAHMLSAMIDLLKQTQLSRPDLQETTALLASLEKKEIPMAPDRRLRGLPRLVVGDALDNLKIVDPSTGAEGLQKAIALLLKEYSRWLSTVS